MKVRPDHVKHFFVCGAVSFLLVALGSRIMPIWISALMVALIAFAKILADWIRFGKVLPEWNEYVADYISAVVIGGGSAVCLHLIMEVVK